MIYDQIGNAARYRALHPLIAKGLDYLAAFDPAAFVPGKVEIEGDALFAAAAEYQSKLRETAKWESHRRYADIQFIVEGEEQMAYAPIASLVPKGDYDEAKDLTLYVDTPETGQLFRFPAGTFAIYFPEDGHLPNLAIGAPSRMRKIVVKVKL